MIKCDELVFAAFVDARVGAAHDEVGDIVDAPRANQGLEVDGDVQGSGSARQLYFEAMTERAQLDTEKLRNNLYGRPEVDG